MQFVIEKICAKVKHVAVTEQLHTYRVQAGVD